MSRLVLATGNCHKVEEIAPLFAAPVELLPVTVFAPDWNVEETGATLIENARLKAHAALAATGLPAVADDTGLFIPALDGAPGVRSSRYAGEHATYAENVARLLAALSEAMLTEEGAGSIERVADRRAQFRTVAVLMRSDGAERVFEGALEGTIEAVPRGTGGFGYDPVFRPLGGHRTLAELSLADKNARSHRAIAFTKVAAFLAARPRWLDGGD